MKLTPVQELYLINFQAKLIERETLIELFTITDFTMLTIPDNALETLNKTGKCSVTTGQMSDTKILTLGKLFHVANSEDVVFLLSTEKTTSEIYECQFVKLGTINKPLMQFWDEFELAPGKIINYPSGVKLNTTVGLFILNYIVFADAFGEAIPYFNDLWVTDKIEEKVARLMSDGKASVDQFYKFIDNMYFIGHFTELSVPSFTERSFTTDPTVAARRDALLKEYEGRTSDPAVIKLIEDELMALDRAHIGDDPSSRFYIPLGAKKTFGVHRKKMFLTVGGIEAFDDTTGGMDFITNSLREGWNKKDFVAICNEIRKGSYTRGKETEKGGTLTKFLMRVFQNLEITQENCQTTRGIKFVLLKDLASEYLGRYIIQAGKLVLLSEDNIGQYIGKEVLLRSPMYCQAEDGLCYTCVSNRFRLLKTKRVGMIIVDISSTFTTLSMKNMHGTKIELTDVDFTEYFK